jgi:hypothetical protein
MLKSAYDEECLSRTSVFKWHKMFKERESRYKTMKGKAVLQLPELKNRRKSFKSVLPKIELLVFWMLEEMTGINRETVCKIVVED